MRDSVLRIHIGNGNGTLRGLARIVGFRLDDLYRFRILQAPAQANPIPWSKSCTLGVSRAEIDLMRYRFPSETTLEKIGIALGEAIFDRQIYAIYQNSFGLISENQKLRVLLSFEDDVSPTSVNVPWESIFQYIRTEKGHFGLSQQLSIARFIPKTEIQPQKIVGRLRVMAVAPNPHRCATALDSAKELSLMAQIAGKRPDAIDFRSFKDTQWKDFQFEFPAVNPHVLIYTGHGKLVEGNPQLLFQTAQGDCNPIPIGMFADTLRPLAGNLRLVILSACETAIAGEANPFSSAAAELIENNIPVVVAMQSKVEETAAREFVLRFFTYLLQNHAIDTCVNAGRLAMREDERDQGRIGETQWAVPVLYLSTRTEEIFNFGGDSNVNPDLEKRREINRVKFPRCARPFIKRPAIFQDLTIDYQRPGVTVIYGPFGAGKTQLISSLCASTIESPDQNEVPPLFFYIRCKEEWTRFDSVLAVLDEQGKTLGFDGFGSLLGERRDTELMKLEEAQINGLQEISDILGQPHPEDDAVNIRRFIDLLATNRFVVAFDDYPWTEEFWEVLFGDLITYLQKSKVYVITSSNEFVRHDGDYSTIKVSGFSPDEAEAFIQADRSVDSKTDDAMLAVAASVDYFPWYMKIIRDLFKGSQVIRPELPIEARANEFLAEIDRQMDDPRRVILKQLSVLRHTITLRSLATMLDSTDPSEYLETALSLQRESLLTFTRNLGVELPSNLRRYYLEAMSEDELIQYHGQAAEFYKAQAGTVFPETAESRTRAT